MYINMIYDRLRIDRPWKSLSRGCTRGGGNRASRLQESVSDIYDYYEYGIYLGSLSPAAGVRDAL